MTEKQLIEWTEYFIYDESSPTCLRWQIDKSFKNNRKVTKGSIAGSNYTDKRGYRVASSLRMNGKTYYVHRIIWELFNGPISNDMIIDHVDRNPWNNRIDNLCMKTQHDNMNNKSKYKTNSSGKTGVCWHTIDGGRFTYAVARWVENGKEQCKNFSVHKLGLMVAWRDAVLYRNSMVNYLNQNTGRKYTPTHGE